MRVYSLEVCVFKRNLKEYPCDDPRLPKTGPEHRVSVSILFESHPLRPAAGARRRIPRPGDSPPTTSAATTVHGEPATALPAPPPQTSPAITESRNWPRVLWARQTARTA